MEVGGKGEVKGKREEQEDGVEKVGGKEGEEERRRGRRKGEWRRWLSDSQEYNSSHHFQRQR